MLYYKVKYNDGNEDVFGSPKTLKPNMVVVIPVGDNSYTCGRIACKVSTLTGLVHEQDYGEVLPILSVIDVADFEKSRVAKVQMGNMERLLNQKMSELKTIDTLEKFAGKDPAFADLLNEYKQMRDGIVPSSESEDLKNTDTDADTF